MASAEGQAARVRVVVQPAFQDAWHAPVKVVAFEGQINQGEAAQLQRYLPAQLVFTQVKTFQGGEVAQLRRYLSAQLVPTDVQS